MILVVMRMYQCCMRVLQKWLLLRLGCLSTSLMEVPSRLQRSFWTWKKSRAMPNATIPSCNDDFSCLSAVSVSFPPVVGPKVNLKATSQRQLNFEAKNFSNGRLCRIRPISQLCSPHSTCMDTRISSEEMRSRNHSWPHVAQGTESCSVLSLHTPVYCLNSYEENITWQTATIFQVSITLVRYGGERGSVL